MTEKRRLRKDVEVRRDTFGYYLHLQGRAVSGYIDIALTEPIPEEEATGEKWVKGFEAVEPPNLLARVEALEEREVDHGDKLWQLMSGAGLTRPVRTVRSPAPASEGMTDEQMRALVKECGLNWQHGYTPLFPGDPTNRYAVLIKALEERIDSQEDRHQVPVGRVEVVEERLGEMDRRLCGRITILEQRSGLSSTSAPASEAPSAEEVVAWLTGMMGPYSRVAIHMIRAHEKPELTPEIVERAARAHYGSSWAHAHQDIRDAWLLDTEAALRSTEMFR